HYPGSAVLWAPPTPGGAGSGSTRCPVLRHTEPGLPRCATVCVCVLRPLPRRADRRRWSGARTILAAFADQEAARRPHHAFSRPAQASLALRPAHLPTHLPWARTWSSDRSVTLPAVQVATGMPRRFPGPDFHRQHHRTFPRHTLDSATIAG